MKPREDCGVTCESPRRAAPVGRAEALPTPPLLAQPAGAFSGAIRITERESLSWKDADTVIAEESRHHDRPPCLEDVPATQAAPNKPRWDEASRSDVAGRLRLYRKTHRRKSESRILRAGRPVTN